MNKASDRYAKELQGFLERPYSNISFDHVTATIFCEQLLF